MTPFSKWLGNYFEENKIPDFSRVDNFWIDPEFEEAYKKYKNTFNSRLSEIMNN